MYSKEMLLLDCDCKFPFHCLCAEKRLVIPIILGFAVLHFSKLNLVLFIKNVFQYFTLFKTLLAQGEKSPFH